MPTVKSLTMYRWSHRTNNVQAIECLPTGRRDYFFVSDPEDASGGTVVWRGSLFDSAEACWNAEIRSAEQGVVSAENRLADLRRRRERAIA